MPTAVAWRTAVALGDDCDARPYCVDKLLKLAAKGQVEIGRKTLIVVDEAGMLSTRQAHHILQLSARHGAKVVFAGDTRQQQPVEAGPGLRLIRDVAGSVRVDRIRRQKADLEDVLVHVHGETPEQARFRAGLTNPQERDSILADYEAMDRKPVFTPWQVSVSEALRDGEAEQAIEAWRLRGRLHLCHDEEKTLTRLVDDWERHVRVEPDAATVVLARTRAEARALSWLMRQRVLAHTPEAKRAVIEVSRDLDGRLTEPLEIAVGDRLRIGATQWDKQLFNGTVVTVEDLKVLHGEERKAGRAAGTGRGEEPERPEDESPVLVTARTEDGRRVTFRHDEIRDYKDNIRLDYGYAMTIASAQGLTVDRAFLLVDDRPARETVYPAATRHREGIDIYVNRAPIVVDIADRRPEDQADMPVTDSDIRAWLAERWSRSQPKEAALDYVADGAWRDPREEPERRPGDLHGFPVSAADSIGLGERGNRDMGRPALSRIDGVEKALDDALDRRRKLVPERELEVVLGLVVLPGGVVRAGELQTDPRQVGADCEDRLVLFGGLTRHAEAHVDRAQQEASLYRLLFVGGLGLFEEYERILEAPGLHKQAAGRQIRELWATGRPVVSAGSACAPTAIQAVKAHAATKRTVQVTSTHLAVPVEQTPARGLEVHPRLQLDRKRSSERQPRPASAPVPCLPIGGDSPQELPRPDSAPSHCRARRAYQRSVNRNCTPCSGASSFAASRRAPSRLMARCGASDQRAPARHVRLPAMSVTVTVASAVFASAVPGVPLIAPVVLSMPSPGGRPVAP